MFVFISVNKIGVRGLFPFSEEDFRHTRLVTNRIGQRRHHHAYAKESVGELGQPHSCGWYSTQKSRLTGQESASSANHSGNVQILPCNK